MSRRNEKKGTIFAKAVAGLTIVIIIATAGIVLDVKGWLLPVMIGAAIAAGLYGIGKADVINRK